MTRARATADTQDNIGGAVAPFVAGKNFVVNGGLDWWQRGTSFSNPAAAYTADRWAATPSAGGTNFTVSRQAGFSGSSQYCLRLQRNSGQTGTAALFLGMAFESTDVIRWQGRTMTWSFSARAGSNFSAGGSAINVTFFTGTGTDQGPFVGHTGEAAAANLNQAITTTATRYSFTFTVPANATSARWHINYTPTGTAGANDFFEIADMQLELGSVATPFSRAGGTLAGELAACQRYYQRFTGDNNAQDWFSVFGVAYSSTNATIYCQHPVTMRAKPTAVDFANLIINRIDTGGQIAVSSLALNNNNPNQSELIAVGGGFLANFAICQLRGDGSGVPFIGFSAEL